MSINWTSPVLVDNGDDGKYYQFIGMLSNDKKIKVTYRFRKLTERWEYDVKFEGSRIYYASYEATESQAIKQAIATAEEMANVFKN